MSVDDENLKVQSAVSSVSRATRGSILFEHGGDRLSASAPSYQACHLHFQLHLIFYIISIPSTTYTITLDVKLRGDIENRVRCRGKLMK